MDQQTGPLIVQSDKTVLLDVHDEGYEAGRDGIAPFAELVKSPEHLHTYRISPLSLWNAAAVGLTADYVIETLRGLSRYPVPGNIEYDIRETIDRFGTVRLRPEEEDGLLFLEVDDPDVRRELANQKDLAKLFRGEWDRGFRIALEDRGTLKQRMMEHGYPVKDEAPLVTGDPLAIPLKDTLPNGAPFTIRDYQAQATASFLGDGRPGSGYGSVVLPCGAGKTIVGLAVMSALATNTLILTSNVSATHQWIRELLEKTDLTEADIGEYSGDVKEVRPVTIATYQILVWRRDTDGPFPHFDLFRKRNWGLIVYDEVHLLPAPVFRITAEIQARRRLGLTATLVREDGREADVFALVGPKRYDAPWKQLEQQGWIAEAVCQEIRLDLPEDSRGRYSVANRREKFRMASENPDKIQITRQLVEKHAERSILVIGQYLSQLKTVSESLGAPIITGQTPNRIRDEMYQLFREGEIRVLVVSKVANFAIDLPDASVAIQLSGTFGSRQEEAQRLGRILRPKNGPAFFYTLVTRYTVEEEFAANRQKFLTEQGYRYSIALWETNH
ncbi:MAG: DNA repair helicase XPB, partial [Spirochaetaceae bacterium]